MQVVEVDYKVPGATTDGELLEGVTYDARNDALYYIDIPKGTIYKVDKQGIVFFKIDESVGVIGLTTDCNKLICGVSKSFKILDLVDGSIEEIVKYPNENIVNEVQLRSNDGSVTPKHNFIVGTNDLKEEHMYGSLWSLNCSDNSLSELWGDCGIPNGINWDLKRNLCYWTDSVTQTVYKYDYYLENDEIDLKSKQEWFKVDENGNAPDGSCLDSEGNLYVCIWGGYKIVRIQPNGKIDMEFKIPAKNVTCCTFGGEFLSILYITTAKLTSNDLPDSTDLGGSVFSIDLKEFNIKGLPKFQFKL